MSRTALSAVATISVDTFRIWSGSSTSSTDQFCACPGRSRETASCSAAVGNRPVEKPATLADAEAASPHRVSPEPARSRRPDDRCREGLQCRERSVAAREHDGAAECGLDGRKDIEAVDRELQPARPSRHSARQPPGAVIIRAGRSAHRLALTLGQVPAIADQLRADTDA